MILPNPAVKKKRLFIHFFWLLRKLVARNLYKYHNYLFFRTLLLFDQMRSHEQRLCSSRNQRINVGFIFFVSEKSLNCLNSFYLLLGTAEYRQDEYRVPTKFQFMPPRGSNNFLRGMARPSLSFVWFHFWIHACARTFWVPLTLSDFCRFENNQKHM